MVLTPGELCRAILVFNRVLGAAVELPGLEKGRTGGFLCFGNLHSEDPFVMLGIGSHPDKEASDRCRKNALEKVERLTFEHPTHLTTFESADMHLPYSERKKWGGGVRLNKAEWPMSFSGFSELADEAYVLYCALALGWISPIIVRSIAEAHENHFYFNLVRACGLNIRQTS